MSGEGLLTLDVAPVVWLGGLPDMSELAGAQGEAVTLARYKGCIRRVKRLRSCRRTFAKFHSDWRKPILGPSLVERVVV